MYQIADLNEHPTLKALNEELSFNKRAEQADQKRIMKEVEELREKYKTAHKDFWERVETYIIENNLVKDGYERGKEAIYFSQEHKTLIYRGKIEDEEEEHPLKSILRDILT